MPRRTMVFIDGSALRDSLLRFFYADLRRQELALDYHALGRFLCAGDQELIRVHYYTGRPVAIEEVAAEGGGEPRVAMGDIELHRHEAHRARRVLENHHRLEEHVKRCRYTRLSTGRVVARRRHHRYGPAFAWAGEILAAAGGGAMSPEDAALFEAASRANHEARLMRRRLVARLEELCAAGAVAPAHLPRYAGYVTTLRDESIHFKEKGVDTLLTVEMLESCLRDAFDDAVLFAADEDYVPLVEAVKRTGRRVIHAFLDIPNPGRRLREACDDTRLVTASDLKRTSFGAATAGKSDEGR